MNNRTLETSSSNNIPAIILILLVLAASNIMLYGVYVFAVLAGAYLILMGRISLPRKSISILAFAGIHFFFSAINGETILSSVKLFVMPLIWIFAYSLQRGRKLESVETVLIALTFGMAIHGFANYVYNTINGIDLSMGEAYDFFSGDVSAATGQAINFTMLVAIVFWLVFVQPKVWLKLAGIVGYIVAIVYDVQIGGRTFLILSVIALIAGIIFYIAFTMRANSKSLFKIMFTVIFIITLIAIVVVMYQSDAFGIKSMYEDSYLFRRLDRQEEDAGIFNDVRFERKRQYMEHMFTYLFGGNHISIDEHVGYAHELWLDVFDAAGIFAYIAIVIYTFASIGRFLKVIRNKNTSQSHKVCFACFLLIMLLQFFVEPILAGAPMLFYAYLVIDGMLAGYVEENIET